jgi:uncharacterized membrane protein
MIIMALDHTRDFFHVHAMSDDPLNMATTSPALFFTRWITHFCAPLFTFLAGTSGYLQGMRKEKGYLSSFLITRGIWLIVVDAIIMTFAFTFDPEFHFIGLQTLWAIGFSMVILGLMIWLPLPVIFITGLVIVFGHNALDFYEKGLKTSPGWWYDFLHHQNIQSFFKGHQVLLFYPVLSWCGLMMLGYSFGKVVSEPDISIRNKNLLIIGSAAIALFVIIRFINVYGDPDPWSTQPRGAIYTFLSFLNTHKYPPSLLYMLMTIGPGMLFLAFCGEGQNAVTRFISVFGRVPFFYYILHFFLLHAGAMAMFFINGHTWAEGQHPTEVIPFYVIPGVGLSLPYVYLVWIAAIILLYPVCKWYDKYKAKHKNNKWLSYL